METGRTCVNLKSWGPEVVLPLQSEVDSAVPSPAPVSSGPWQTPHIGSRIAGASLKYGAARSLGRLRRTLLEG